MDAVVPVGGAVPQPWSPLFYMPSHKGPGYRLCSTVLLTNPAAGGSRILGADWL